MAPLDKISADAFQVVDWCRLQGLNLRPLITKRAFLAGRSKTPAMPTRATSRTSGLLDRARRQDPVKAARDAAIIQLMFDLALRCGEMAGLNLEDLETAGRRLWIKGKGRTQMEARTLPEPVPWFLSPTK